MPQSSAIFAAIGLAFLLFITQRGELRLYMGFLLGTTAAPASAPAQSQASANGVTLNSAAGWLNSVGTAFSATDVANTLAVAAL